MSFPSQVCMSELQSFMTPAFIINAFQKLGHHPISAVISKKRKGDDKEVCIIQFANDDAAKQAVIKLNGKAIPGGGYVSTTKFKLTQCIGNRTSEWNVWVGDLTLDVDDYHFFKFFSQNYKTLCNAKVITDPPRNVSRGYGFLRFSSEDEQKHCLNNMGNSLGLGGRPIKVGPVSKSHIGSHGMYISDTAAMALSDEHLDEKAKAINAEPWRIYTSWNQFKQPSAYKFVATVRKSVTKEDTNPNQDLRLVDYNVSVSTEDQNKEIIERDCYLWDALECTQWLPEFALSTSVSGKA